MDESQLVALLWKLEVGFDDCKDLDSLRTRAKKALVLDQQKQTPPRRADILQLGEKALQQALSTQDIQKVIAFLHAREDDPQETDAVSIPGSPQRVSLTHCAVFRCIASYDSWYTLTSKDVLNELHQTREVASKKSKDGKPADDRELSSLCSLTSRHDPKTHFFVANTSRHLVESLQSQFEDRADMFQPIALRGHEVVDMILQKSGRSADDIHIGGLSLDHGSQDRTVVVGNVEWQWSCLVYFSKVVALEVAILDLIAYFADASNEARPTTLPLSILQKCERFLKHDFHVLSQTPTSVHCIRGVNGIQPEVPCIATFTSQDRYSRFKHSAGLYASGMHGWQDKVLSGMALCKQLSGADDSQLSGLIINPEVGDDIFTSPSFVFIPRDTALNIMENVFDHDTTT